MARYYGRNFSTHGNLRRWRAPITRKLHRRNLSIHADHPVFVAYDYPGPAELPADAALCEGIRSYIERKGIEGLWHADGHLVSQDK